MTSSIPRPGALIVTERPYDARTTVYWGETWYDPLPQLVDPLIGDPFDITGVTIDIIIRPSAAHATQLLRLTSAGGGIVKDNAALGLASIFYSKAGVEANLPVSPVGGWWHMQRLSWTDPTLGAVKKILAEGPLHVFAGRDA